MKYPIFTTIATVFVGWSVLSFWNVGYWKWTELSKNVWYNNAWAWTHFVNGQMAYSVTQRLDLTLLLAYLYETAYGLKKIYCMRGHGDPDWSNEDTKAWLEYTHFDTLVTDPLMAFMGALCALVVFRLFPSDSVLFGKQDGVSLTERSILRAAAAILIFFGGPGDGRLVVWVFARVTAGLAFAITLSTGVLNAPLGYTNVSWIPFTLVWTSILVSYAVVRYGIRPERWTLPSSEDDDDFIQWRIDQTDRRPFTLYALIGGLSSILLGVLARLTCSAIKKEKFIVYTPILYSQITL